MTRKPADLVPLMLRLPEGLRHWIEQEAKDNQRSLNAEVVYKLDQWRQRDHVAKTTAAAAATEIFAKLKSGELQGPLMETRRRKKS